MFNYPNIEPCKIAFVDQLCVKCEKWFRVDNAATRLLETRWADRQACTVPFTMTCCTRCGVDGVF